MTIVNGAFAVVFLDQADDAIALVRQAGHGKDGRLRLDYAKGSDRGAPATVGDRFRVERPRVELTRRRQLAGAQGTCGIADDLRETSLSARCASPTALT